MSLNPVKLREAVLYLSCGEVTKLKSPPSTKVSTKAEWLSERTLLSICSFSGRASLGSACTFAIISLPAVPSKLAAMALPGRISDGQRTKLEQKAALDDDGDAASGGRRTERQITNVRMTKC